MSQQNVYFTNPSQITTLQTNVTALQNDAGFGQTISANASSAVSSWLNTFAADTFGAYFYGGNVKSNQELFSTAGVMNASGAVYSTDAIINTSSVGKLLTGMVIAKMIEEDIVDPLDKCSTYITDMRGTGTYWNTLTVTNPATFPLDPSSYTGTIGTFQWEDVTINDLLHFNLGLMDDSFATPSYSYYYLNSGAISSAIADGSVQALGNLVQFSKYFRALIGDGTSDLASVPNGPIGLSSTTFNNRVGYVSIIGETGANTKVGGNYIKRTVGFTLRDGFTDAGYTYPLGLGSCPSVSTTTYINPLMYKPGTVRNDVSPYKVSTVPSTYDTAYIFLSAVIEYALNAYNSGTYALGSAFTTYARSKILNPLGMYGSSTGSAWISFQETAPAITYTATSQWASTSFRRSPSAGLTQVFNLADRNTWIAYGCSTGYRNALGGATSGSGPLLWANDYLLSNANNDNRDYIANQAIGSYTRSTNVTGLGTPTFTLGHVPLMCTIGALGKLIKLMANRGLAADGTRILKTETWNYLVSPKVGPATIPQTPVVPYPFVVDPSNGNFSYCLGFQRCNRDLSNESAFGFDESTIEWIGAAGLGWYADFYTGNWFVYGMPQSAQSSGLIPVPNIGNSYIGGKLSVYTMAKFLKKLIA